MPRVAFADFTFDLDDRTLRRRDEIVALVPKASEALALLLGAPGSVISKEAIREHLWPEGFVEDGNLTQTIYLVRRALDPQGDGRAFIDTVPRRGYRFRATVTTLDDAAPPVQAAPRARAWLPQRWIGLVAALVLVFGFAAYARVRTTPSSQTGLAPEAARAYTLGRFEWNKRTAEGVRGAIEDFDRVIAVAPASPLGYVGVADAYLTAANWEFSDVAAPARAYAQAEKYARLALERDPSSGEAQATLAYLAMDRDHDMTRAQQLLGVALALRPDYAPAHEYAAIARLDRGDVAGAIRESRRSIELDPLSPLNLGWYGTALYFDGKLPEARIALEQARHIAPNNGQILFKLAMVDIAQRRYADARFAIAQIGRSSHRQHMGDTTFLLALIDTREHGSSNARLDLRPRDAHVDAVVAAALCDALGKRDDAIAWIAFMLREPSARMTRGMTAAEPLLGSLRGDRRFIALVS